jgi:hypothetical protein
MKYEDFFLNRVNTNKSTSKQHRKLRFGLQSYLNQNKEIQKCFKLGSTPQKLNSFNLYFFSH